MAKFGLIGYPAAGSQSPALFSAAYGGRYPYEIIEEADFAVAFEKFLREDFQAVNITAPYKIAAASAADWRSPEVERIGAANILAKTDRGVEAYNTDVAAVMCIAQFFIRLRSAVVVGFGGAGKAAYDALQRLGIKTSVLHHTDSMDFKSDLVIYTLPCAVPGLEKIRCKYLVEANYINPVCQNLTGIKNCYVGGKAWLFFQAAEGYELMTGETPDRESMMSDGATHIYLKI